MQQQSYDPTQDIDYEEIERFMRAVYEPGDWVEFRCIRPDRERGTVSCYIDVGRFLNDRPETIKQWLDVHHNPRYAGLYLGANPRKPRSGYGPARSSSAEDVSTFRVAFTDLDNCNPNDALALLRSSGLPDPTLIVHSGRSTGTHLYWRFEQEMGAETWGGVQRALQNRLNGDKMKDPPRVMRVPGSYNFKRKNNARILKEGQRYESYLSLNLSVDEMLPPTYAVADPGISPDERNLNWTSKRYMASDGIPEGGGDDWGGRNNALFSVACDFIANGFSFEDTCDRLMSLACDRDGLPEFEAKRTISNAVNRNPTRTLMVNITGVDETWTNYMKRPQCADRPIPRDTKPERFEGLESRVRYVRAATEQEMIDFAIMRGEIDLPHIDHGEDATDEEPEADDRERSQSDDLSSEDIERIRYEQELAEIEQWELSAPAIVSNYHPGIIEPEPGTRQKAQAVKFYRSADQVIDDIRDGFSGWPKYAPGMGLFGYRPHGDHGDEIVHGLPTAPSLFAFLKSVGHVRWTNEPTIFQQQSVTRELRPLKESEAFELLKERCPNRYRGFCQTPHIPAIDGFYYPSLSLPEPSPGFEVLNQFLNALNPETHADKMLLLAAILTPAWGGPPGARPLFTIASDHGQGAGKTETVKAISAIWGGYYPLSMEKSWSDNAKMMMSSNDWLTRCCVWDNVKGRFSSGEIEGAVTSDVVQGHRMYVGTVKRYNDITFFVTLNNPDMSRDLAQRAVVIKLGAPKSGNFTDWWRVFIDENGRQLIADALAMLSRPSIKFDFSRYPDRWRAWQRGVLAKIPGIDLDQIMLTTRDRRDEVDSETDEGEQIVRAVIAHVARREELQDNAEEYVLSQIEIQHAIEAAGLWKTDSKGTNAQNSRKMASFVLRRTSSLGLLSRPHRQYVSVNDRGAPVSGRSPSVSARSPKWVLDWAAANRRFGDDLSIEQYGSSGSPDDIESESMPPV